MSDSLSDYLETGLPGPSSAWDPLGDYVGAGYDLSPNARALNFTRSARSLNFTRDQASGFFTGEAAIPWAEVEATNARFEQLNADVAAFVSTSPEKNQATLLEWQPVWTGWQVQFSEWARRTAEDMPPGVPRAILGATAVTGYEAWVRRYNEALRKAKARGVSTQAEEADSRSPLERAMQSLTKALPYVAAVALLAALGPSLVTLAGGLVARRRLAR